MLFLDVLLAAKLLAKVLSNTVKATGLKKWFIPIKMYG